MRAVALDARQRPRLLVLVGLLWLGQALPVQSFWYSRPRFLFVGRTATPASMIQKDRALGPRVLLESDRYLVIDKPPNLSHHSSFGASSSGDPIGRGSARPIEEPGIIAVLRQQQVDGHLAYAGRLFGVHRLDRVTSGILVLAKDSGAAQAFAAAFREMTAVKYYTGLSHCKPSAKKQGWVKGGMERGRRKSWFLTRDTKNTAPNYAVTRFFTAGLGSLQEYHAPSTTEILDPDGSEPLPPPRTLLLFRPHTGRTHQLRVAAKSVGLPLVGDPLYRDAAHPAAAPHRTYLHATALHIPLPSLNDHITVFSPPPFEHLWTPGTGQDLFHQQVVRLFEKHCEEPAIWNLVERYCHERPLPCHES